jgi:lysophospholipase L1-like esterase
MKHHFYVARLPGILRGAASAAEPDTVRTPQPDALRYFERNLERLVALGVDTGAVVLLATDPSSLRTKYDPDDTSSRSYWIRDAETTQAYRDSLDVRLRGIAREAREADLWVAAVPAIRIDPEHFLDDAHLTPAGNRRFAAALVAALEPWLNGEAAGSAGASGAAGGD